MKGRITLILYFMFGLFAYGSDDYVPKSPTEGLSPNAKSFHRYGEIPVSLYTGTPSVEIPLISIEEGQLSLSLDLSYHSGGIKADEHPGWTGLGWTLTAGGAITREVRDLPDETRRYGYRNICRELQLDKATADFANKFTNNLMGDYLSPVGDSEPDKFNFQIPGYSGYFMMNPSGEWQICCDRPLKVKSLDPISPSVRFSNGSSTLVTQQPVYQTFILTGEDGTEYTFGEQAFDLSINSASQTDSDWETTAWYLTEIKHPCGSKISFKYERGDFVVNFSKGFTNYIASSTYQVSMSSKGGRLVSPVYLSEIIGATFKVKLISSPSIEMNYSGDDYMLRQTPVNTSSKSTQPIYCPSNGHSMREEVRWRQLDNLLLLDQSGSIVRHIDFKYSNSESQRLTLLDVTLSESGSAKGEKYNFTYNNVSSLPLYLSDQVDHWGYAGCKSTSIDSELYREPSPSVTPYGLLKEIVYPTGGKTVLEFEPHTYTYIVGVGGQENENKAGGYRIKRIINVPANGALPEVKEYRYHGGMLEGKPVYKSTLNYIQTTGSRVSVNVESSNSLSAVVNNYGHHICYPTVTELHGDSSRTVTEFISPTVLEFRDESPIAASDPSAFVNYSCKGHYRGKPMSITEYSNTGRIKRSTQIVYRPLSDREVWVPSLYSEWLTIPNAYNQHAGALFIPKYSLYRNYIHSVLETERTVENYASSGYKCMGSTTYKVYSTSGQLKRDSTVVRYSDGDEDTDVTRYYYQWEKESWYESRNIKNLLSDIVRVHNGKTIKHISNRFVLQNNTFPVLHSVSELFDGDDERQMYICELSDDIGKPVHVVDADGLHIIYLWSPDRLCPLVEIRNADLQTVRQILGYNPSDAYKDASLKEKIPILRRLMKSAMVTDYTYIPFLGVTSVTDPSGKTTRYDYDDQKRLTRITDTDGNIRTRYYYSTYSEVMP